MTERVGSFELGEPLGAGAFATVYRARQERLDRDVAVKVLDPALARNPEIAGRFEREGRAAARLDHPAIVTVFEAGEDDGVVYLAMQLVEGGTLGDRLRHSGTLTVEDTVRLLRPVAEALDHAHSRGVVHRDVKPANIMVGDGDRSMLGDFGIASTAAELSNYTTGAIGTANYMSPEQANGDEVGPATDRYALGCVVHECLVGSAPFLRPDLMATLVAHMQEPVPPTGRADLDQWMARALAKAPEERFASGAAMIDALAELAGPGVTAIPAAAATVVDGPASGAAAEHALTVLEAPSAAAPTSASRQRIVMGAVLIGVLVAAAVGILLATGGDEPEDDAGPAAAATDEPAATTEPTASATEPTAAPAIVPPPTTPVGGDISIGIDVAQGAFDSLDPHQEPFNTLPLVGSVYPTLFDTDEELRTVASTAAALPEVLSTSPFVVQYRIADAATWDDATPITAADAEATRRYIADLGDAAFGDALYRTITDLTVVDDKTFTVTWDEPTAAHVFLFSSNHPLVKGSAYDDHLAAGGTASDFLTDDIGFSGGPFRLTGVDFGVSLRLARNDGWWGEPAPLDTVTIRYYGGSAAVVDALADSDVDAAYIRRPTIGDRSTLESAGATVQTGPGETILSIAFNPQRAVGGDLAVRQAMAAAIDRDDIIGGALSQLTGEAEDPAQSLGWSEVHHGAAAPWADVGGDLDAAGRILVDGGWELRDFGEQGQRWFRGNQELLIDLLWRGDNALGQGGVAIPVQIFNDLEPEGFGLQVLQRDRDDFNAALAAGDYDAYLFEFPVQASPAFLLQGAASATNGGGFGNDGPAADLLAQAVAAADLDEHIDLINQAELALLDDMAGIPLLQTPAFIATSAEFEAPALFGRVGGPLRDLAGWSLAGETPADG